MQGALGVKIVDVVGWLVHRDHSLSVGDCFSGTGALREVAHSGFEFCLTSMVASRVIQRLR